MEILEKTRLCRAIAPVPAATIPVGFGDLVGD